MLENQDLTNSPSIKLQQPAKQLTPVATAISSSNKPFISTNLESVITRGDLQLAYESPKPGGWASIVYLHINPQDTFTRFTGDYGLMGGGRLYVDKGIINSDIYLQGLVGFNHYSSWDLMVSLEAGQRIHWKKNVHLDLALVVNRSYDKDVKNPMAYLKASLVFTLNKAWVPFL